MTHKQLKDELAKSYQCLGIEILGNFVYHDHLIWIVSDAGYRKIVDRYIEDGKTTPGLFLQMTENNGV